MGNEVAFVWPSSIVHSNVVPTEEEFLLSLELQVLVLRTWKLKLLNM
jgi:hypothetical protein